MIMPIVLYRCEAWSLTLREALRLRVLENMVLRRMFGPKTDEAKGSGGKYLLRSLMICTPHQILQD
jgi:hypothetical protein